MKKKPDENKLCIHSCNTPRNNNNNNSNFSGFFRHAEKQPRKYQKANVIEIKKEGPICKTKNNAQGHFPLFSPRHIYQYYTHVYYLYTPLCIIIPPANEVLMEIIRS